MNGARAPQAYDRDKLVELFGDDPATLAEVEREFLDTARTPSARSRRRTTLLPSRARRTG